MHSHLNRRVLNLVVFPYLAAARTARAASSSSSAAVCASPDEPWAETGAVNRARYEPDLLRSVDWAKAARRKGKAREFDSQDGHNREARDTSDKQGRPPDRLRVGTPSIGVWYPMDFSDDKLNQARHLVPRPIQLLRNALRPILFPSKVSLCHPIRIHPTPPVLLPIYQNPSTFSYQTASIV